MGQPKATLPQDSGFVIYSYTLQEAIADGVLVPLGRANNKPLIATKGTDADLSTEELTAIVWEFLEWQHVVEPILEPEDRTFVFTASNGKNVWVIDDGSVITIMYPGEY